jgi:hypothetical protein
VLDLKTTALQDDRQRIGPEVIEPEAGDITGGFVENSQQEGQAVNMSGMLCPPRSGSGATGIPWTWSGIPDWRPCAVARSPRAAFSTLPAA